MASLLLASRSLPSLLLLPTLVLLLLAYAPAPILAADSSTSCAASGVVTCASALIGKLKGAPDSCAFKQEYYGIIASCKEQCTTACLEPNHPQAVCARDGTTFSPDTCSALRREVARHHHLGRARVCVCVCVCVAWRGAVYTRTHVCWRSCGGCGGGSVTSVAMRGFNGVALPPQLCVSDGSPHPCSFHSAAVAVAAGSVTASARRASNGLP